jgi:hypothetical protein
MGMHSKSWIYGKFFVFLVFPLIFFLMPSDVHAEWYRVKVVKLQAYSNSEDITVTFEPGFEEEKFTEKGRGFLSGREPGMKVMLSLLILSVSTNQEAKIWIDGYPNKNEPPPIESVTILAP